MFLVNLMALGRNLVGLLHSNSTEKSNKMIKTATMFQNRTKKLQKLQNYVSSIVFHYITDFFLWWVARNLSLAQPSITEGTSNHSLTTGNWVQEIKTAAGVNTNKMETNWCTVTRIIKKFLYVHFQSMLYIYYLWFQRDATM